MSQPYVGEIGIFAFGFAPQGWAPCNGQILPIDQNPALFALLGTTFGGDGIRNFALPNLQGCVPVGQGNTNGLQPWSVGQTFGETNHTLTANETPTHTHILAANANPTARTSSPGSAVSLARTGGVSSSNEPLTIALYAPDPAPNQAMSPSAISITGGSPHANMMPYLTLNFCIALSGIFPSRN